MIIIKTLLRWICAIPFSFILIIWVLCDWLFLKDNERDSWEMLKQLWKGEL